MSAVPTSQHSRADYCTIGVAECFRGDGEVMANPIGTIPAIGGRLARDVFEPDLVMTDGEALLVANALPLSGEPVAKVVETDALAGNGPVQSMLISRLMTHGVVEAPKGAHFTECVPDYGRDEAFQKEYAASAKDPELWAAWKAKYLDCGGHDEYRKVAGL